ncbi:MAG: hypothetical protein QOI08_1436, partial [Actinomycetota bacterium]|nr:hypothetical protein [Actinomycetota bacterium]
QAVGRFVRWTRGVPRQRAWLFIPDDPRLRVHAARVAEQRRHSLRRDDREPGIERAADADPLATDEQLSLFAVISAVATAAAHPADDQFPYELEELDDGDADEFELTLAPPPPLSGGGGVMPDTGAPAITRREEKHQLREANATVARELVRRTGMTHARVNAELNRLSSVRRVSEATIEQLERRLASADKWLAKT